MTHSDNVSTYSHEALIAALLACERERARLDAAGAHPRGTGGRAAAAPKRSTATELFVANDNAPGEPPPF
ncbi:MAG TPA: hypothetical protein VGL26_05025 [Jatrophihabitans sp.]